MLRFGSLRIRIIVLTTTPLIAILVAILVSATRTANETVRHRVHQSLGEAGSVFVQLLDSRRDELVNMTQIIVRDPRFFATFSIPPAERGEEFVPTVEGIAADFLRITDADFIEIFDADGRFMAYIDRAAQSRPSDPAEFGHAGLSRAMKGAPISDFYAMDDQLVAVAVAPVYVGQRLQAIVRLGGYLDDAFVGEVRRLTGADICLAQNGRAISTTFPAAKRPEDSARWAARSGGNVSQGPVTLSEAFNIAHASKDYLTIHVGVGGVEPRDGFDAFIGRELRAELTPIHALEKRIALGGLFAVMITLLVGYYVAHSITRPLSKIVRASVALQRGDYDYPVDLRGQDEIALLGKNFAAMRESLSTYVQHLKSIDQAKSNFIALAAHELRTPLTIITGFNELISTGALGEVPDKVQETTDNIKEHITRLNNNVQSMLDLTYFEQGLQTLVRARCDARELVQDVVLARTEAAETRRLKLVVQVDSEPLVMTADSDRLHTALLALVDNAIRFTPDDGTVTVSAARVQGDVHIVVKDTGVGIPQNELRWIFDKVYEIGDIMHHSSGSFGFGSKGFGLGLALCKAIVDAHEGDIRVHSAPGRGSRFTIVMKSEVQGSREAASEPSQAQGALV